MTYEEALAVATANNEIDENQTFLIDKNLRTVTIPDGFVLGVFNDKNVQIVPFAMPRYYNGIDMSTFAIQVNYVNSAGNGDIYLVFDQDVQEDLILFNWVVDRTAFATSGKTGFVVCMKEDDEYGYVAREFNTTLAYAPVLEGLEIDNPIDEQEVLDVLTQIRRAAERADIAAQQAEDSAAQASTDANTASDAASSATSSAATATAAQQSASASATSATNAETNALSYRNAAAASAAEAAAVVSGIEDVLSFPNALVVESATSEDIVTIEDGADDIPMTSVLATMNPIQDLNGYDKPWSGGGGKNLLNNTSSSTTFNGITWTVNSDGTVTANGTATAESIFVVVIGADELPRETNLYFSGCPSGGSASKYNVYIWDNTTHARAKKWNNITAVDNDTGASANNELYLTSNHEYQYNMRVMSGQTVSNIVFKPMIRLATESDGTFAPYSNICPISGRTGLTVTAANKNLAPNRAGQGSTTSNGITFTYNDDGSVTVNGTATANAYSRAVEGLNYKIYLPHGTYKKPVMQIDASHIVGLYVQYVRIASDWVNVTGGGFGSTTFTIDEDYPIVIRVAVQNGTTVDNVRFEPYVYPDSVSDLTWVSPVKTNYPITWSTEAGEVYGGTLDVVSGVLTVDKVLITLDGTQTIANRNWRPTADSVGWLYPYAMTQNVVPASSAEVPAVTSNRMKAASYSALFNGTENNGIGLVYDTSKTYGLVVRYADTSLTTDAAINAFLAENPIQVAFPLETPQTYQLTPTEIRSLLGGNTIYSDAGSVSVDYRADTKLYINKKIAEALA